MHPLVLDGEGHRCRHRSGEVWIGENGAVVNQGGHRLAASLEQRDRASRAFARENDGLAVTVEVGGNGLGPVENRERRVAENGPQPRLELLRRPKPAELDDRLTRGRLPALRAQLAGHEAKGHDAVLLGSFQQPRSRPLSRRFMLETDLIEAREGVADVGLVVDRQAPAAAGADVGESAIG